MNRDYYGYDTNQLPCRNLSHSTYKNTSNQDSHLTDHYYLNETWESCVFQPCPHRYTDTYQGRPHWHYPSPEEAGRVLERHTDGVELSSYGPDQDPGLEELRRLIHQWKFHNEARSVLGGFESEEEETERLPRNPEQSEEEDVEDLLEEEPKQ